VDDGQTEKEGVMDTSWHSYPKVWNLGHPAVAEIFLDDVIVEEKVDGSQFSFGKFLDDNDNAYLRVRTKGAEMIVDAPEKMFSKGVETAKELLPELHAGWTYRSEFLCKPKHNVLVYDRTPNRSVILFDINTDQERYLSYEEKAAEAKRLGLECVPLLRRGRIETLEEFRALLDTESILGGQKVEGVVAKNYSRFGKDGKALMGKFVSEAYKETHSVEWKKDNPTGGDIVDTLIAAYRTPARWAKCLQHLKEAGKIESSPRDIGALMVELPNDLLAECEEQIKADLFKWAWPKIARGCKAGLPEWYKELLLHQQFNGEK
jgi:hypothetical protein